MVTETGVNYELRYLTLAEREKCNNRRVEVNGNNTVILENSFGILTEWLKFGLIEFDGVKVTDANREEVINSMSDDEIREVAGVIAERTSSGIKKKF